MAANKRAEPSSDRLDEARPAAKVARSETVDAATVAEATMAAAASLAKAAAAREGKKGSDGHEHVVVIIQDDETTSPVNVYVFCRHKVDAEVWKVLSSNTLNGRTLPDDDHWETPEDEACRKFLMDVHDSGSTRTASLEDGAYFTPEESEDMGRLISVQCIWNFY